MHTAAFMSGDLSNRRSEINPDDIISELAKAEYRQSGRVDAKNDTKFVKSLYNDIWNINREYEDIGLFTEDKSIDTAYHEVWNNISEGLMETTIDPWKYEGCKERHRLPLVSW